MVRPSPLFRLHNWWCDIRHNCHKNHRGRGASLSSQRGGKIVFKDFFSRPPEEGGSLSSRNFSSLIFNGKRILQGVLITLKIFYPVEVSLIAKTSTLQYSLESSLEEAEPDTITPPSDFLSAANLRNRLSLNALSSRRIGNPFLQFIQQKVASCLTFVARKMIWNKSGIFRKPWNVNVVLIREIIKNPLKVSLVFWQPETSMPIFRIKIVLSTAYSA